MQVYLVGGAVRDALMRMSGRDVRSSDKDWVVVGSSPKEMLSLGFIPVGHDFPVFLHPKTHEEYALARTERKSGHGYHGFQFFASPSVTLTEDLARRDLTINAMAMTPEGLLIDPFNGKKDLTDRILRHVGPAFCEDPVRILRLARFAARFADFTVAPETATLLKTMVATGEADHLVSERVWAEVSRGLMEEAPSRMIRILKDCGFLSRVFAESPVTESLLSALDYAATENAPLTVRASIAFSGLAQDQVARFCRHHRFPSDVTDAVTLFVKYKDAARTAQSAEEYLNLLNALDVLRRPERLEHFLQALGYTNPDFNQRILKALRAAYLSVDVALLLKSPSEKPATVRIRNARLSAIKEALKCPI